MVYSQMLEGDVFKISPELGNVFSNDEWAKTVELVMTKKIKIKNKPVTN